MRIAVVHSGYEDGEISGENRVVVDQASALEEAGHTVEIFRRDTANLRSPTYPLRAGYWVASGQGPDPVQDLIRFKPDVVHLQNLFPNFGIRWTNDWDGPLVVSLHNFRAVCSNGTLYRHGGVCLECPTRGDHRAVLHGCYRNSRTATIPVALGRRPFRKMVFKRADIVVATSESVQASVAPLIEDSSRLRLLPNFVAEPADCATTARNLDRLQGWVAVGRFVQEKGFMELLTMWPYLEESLLIIGDGPLRHALSAVAQGKNVEFRRPVSRTELRDVLQQRRGLLFPSRWLEVDPQIVAEALRLGVPVAAYTANGSASLVSRHGAGVAFSDSDSLSTALELIRMNPESMAKAARNLYEQRWAKEKWVESIQLIYRTAQWRRS